MTPTHTISADEARRLLHQDRENQRHQSALRAARSYIRAYRSVENGKWPPPPAEHVVTPFGTFTGEELARE